MLQRLRSLRPGRWIERWRMARYEDALCRRGWYDLDARSEAQIIFIGGCSRSGTTLVREILGRHSRLSCGVETAIFVPAFETRRIAERCGIDRGQLEHMVASNRNLLDFSDAFFERFVKAGEASRWVDKSPHNIRIVGQLLAWLPRAVFIHVVRDGRDVACSLRNHPQQKLLRGVVSDVKTCRSIASCAKMWVEEVSLGIEHRGNPRYKEIRYEDLVTDPESVSHELCNFIGEEFEPAMLHPCSRSGSSALFLSDEEAAGTIIASRVGRWDEDLTIGERRTIAEHAGHLLVELGYCVDPAWVDHPVPFAEEEGIGKTVAAMLRRSLIDPKRRARLTVRGGCMAPLINDGDAVVLGPVELPPEIGSVVVVETEPSRLVCHRVQAGKVDGLVVVRGDRSGSAHEVSVSDLIGVVIQVNRGSCSIEMTGFLHDVYAALVLAQARVARSRTIWGRFYRALISRCFSSLSWLQWVSR